MSGKLPISETFISIQGEGGRIGVPSFFIRVSGCNLRCIWCDTPYASWHPEGTVRKVDEILSDFKNSGVRDVVLTGGEPMIFKEIEPLCQGLRGLGSHITIETAGTVFREVECDLMSISPKLANSQPIGHRELNNHEVIRQNRVPLAELTAKYPYQLKFVVMPENGDELEEIGGILRHCRGLSPDQVFLMAEGIEAETLHRRQRDLVPLAIRTGWRIAPRLHVDLYGNTRGT